MRLSCLVIAIGALLAEAHADYDAAARYSEKTGGVSMIVSRDGERVFERYADGAAAGEAHELASGTKSFSGVIAAAAVKDGFLSLDEKAADTLVEWRLDPLKSTVTIRQILHLTSGVKSTGIGRPPAYAAAIALPMATPPGEAFEYGPVNFQIFGEIMRRKLRAFDGGRYKDAVDYLQARVFNPLGIIPAQWNRGRDGNPNLPSGADLTARDWARFGEFILEGGVSRGERLVDGETFDQIFIGSAVNAAYGLGWWLNMDPAAATLASSRTMREASDLFTHPRRKELPADLVMAAGAGNQRLYVIPSKALVIVRQTNRIFQGRRGRKFSDVEFLLEVLN